jgi:hypothetical protein
MNCHDCGALFDDGLGYCPACSAPVRRPGFWQRFWAGLRGCLAPRCVIVCKRVSNIESIEAATGERHTYQSLEELPAEIRAQLDALPPASEVKKLLDLASDNRPMSAEMIAEFTRATGQKPLERFTFVWKDPTGKERVYHSLEEMPPEARAVYEQFLRPEVRERIEAAGRVKLPADDLSR